MLSKRPPGEAEQRPRPREAPVPGCCSRPEAEHPDAQKNGSDPNRPRESCSDPHGLQLEPGFSTNMACGLGGGGERWSRPWDTTLKEVTIHSQPCWVATGCSLSFGERLGKQAFIG